MKKAEELSDEEGRQLEVRLKSLQEKVKALSRTVNPIAQNMLDSEEKRVLFSIIIKIFANNNAIPFLAQ